MRTIDSVEVTEVNDEITLLDWSSTNGEFGRLTIEYNGKGGYTFDAEYLGLDSVISIIQATKIGTNKTKDNDKSNSN
jgi:hypothetical protein